LGGDRGCEGENNCESGEFREFLHSGLFHGVDGFRNLVVGGGILHRREIPPQRGVHNPHGGKSGLLGLTNS
jgi:hypothetical protein